MIPGGKEKVAKRILGFIVPEADKYECPNWILNDFIGMKGSTAERRLRDLRKMYFDSGKWTDIWGYRVSFKQENFWAFSPGFVEYLEEYVKTKEESR